MENTFINYDIAFLCIDDNTIFGISKSDKINFLARTIGTKGRYLSEVRFIQNVPSKIIENLRELKDRYHIVIVSGGIGFDYTCYTAQCIAYIFNDEIEENKDAIQILHNILQKNGLSYDNSLRKAVMMPKSSVVIPNEINGVSGFYYANVFVVHSRNDIFEQMVESVTSYLYNWHRYVIFTVNITNPARELWNKLKLFILENDDITLTVNDTSNNSYEIILRCMGSDILEIRKEELLSILEIH